MLFSQWSDSPGQRLKLEGHQVYLRPPMNRDWSAWSELRAESRDFLTKWEPTWAHDALTRSAFRRRLRAYKAELRQGTSYSFLVFRRSDHDLLGGVTLSNLRRGVAQAASLGYWIGARHSRQGHMSDALTTVLHFAFTELGLHRVEAACLPKNTASKGLLMKCGFREEGYAREYLRIDGRWQDHVLFGILRDEVLAKKRR